MKITQRQLTYIKALVEERIGRSLSQGEIGRLIQLDVKTASDIIIRERQRKDLTLPKYSKPSVPDGRYAIESKGTIQFFSVKTPAEGKWTGFTFLSIQAGDEWFPIKNGMRDSVLSAIAKDPSEASKRYGREIGSCGVCGRTLTNQESRELGIGPVCRNARGW